MVKKQMKIKVLKLLYKSDGETGEKTNENKILKLMQESQANKYSNFN